MEKRDTPSKRPSRQTLTELALGSGASDADDQKSDLVSVLFFESGGESYAIGVEHTEGVVDCPKLTPLPGAPVAVVGIASVRGRMTIVMELGSEPAAAAHPWKQRLILIKGDAQLALLADRVDGVLALEPKRVRPVAHDKEKLTRQRALFKWPARSYFKSGSQRVPIIDVDRLVEP